MGVQSCVTSWKHFIMIGLSVTGRSLSQGTADFLGTATMRDDLRQVWTKASCRERLKMPRNTASWSVHDLSVHPDTLSGRAALVTLILRSVDE